MIWIKNPKAIYARDAENGLVIKNNIIVELVARNNKPTTVVDQVYDASDSVILPGLINTHHHFYQTLTRAYPGALNKELFPWLKSLYKVWAHITPEMHKQATKLACCELLLSGCTTVCDHHYLFPKQLEYAIDTQVEVAKNIGVRAVFTRGSMSLGEKDGGLPPQNVVQAETDIIDDSIRLINNHHENEKGAMIQIALAPCSPFSVSTDLMKESAVIANQYNVRLHTHLAETIDEENFCLKTFGKRTVDYLDSVGWLSDKTWLAHGIHFNEEEIKQLGANKVSISHCPSSNMMLSSGICQTLDLQNAGCNVGLGVDGSASNDHSNMISELRQAMYLQRLNYSASKISAEYTINLATKGSAALLGRNDIGEIAVGKQADLALFKLDEMRFSGAHEPISALLLCGAQRADRVMVAGKWLVKDANLVDIDQSELIYNHSKQAKKLFELAGN